MPNVYRKHGFSRDIESYQGMPNWSTPLHRQQASISTSDPGDPPLTATVRVCAAILQTVQKHLLFGTLPLAVQRERDTEHTSKQSVGQTGYTENTMHTSIGVGIDSTCFCSCDAANEMLAELFFNLTFSSRETWQCRRTSTEVASFLDEKHVATCIGLLLFLQKKRQNK